MSLESAGGNEETKDDQPADAGSVAGSKADSTPDSSERKLSFRISTMNLQEIIDGTKKPGVEVHQSSLLMGKLSLSQQVQLKSHLQLTNWAAALAEEKLCGMSKAEVLEAVAGLQGKVRWPGALKHHMWRREVDMQTQSLLAEAGTQARMTEWWTLIRPWSSLGEAQESFDFNKPVLHLLDFDVKVKAEKFLAELCAGLLVPLIVQGGDGVSRLRMYLPFLQEVSPWVWVVGVRTFLHDLA